MSVYVLLNLLNELGKEINVRLAKHFISFLQRVQEHECQILFITWH